MVRVRRRYVKSADNGGVGSTLVLSEVDGCDFELVCRAEGLCAESMLAEDWFSTGSIAPAFRSDIKTQSCIRLPKYQGRGLSLGASSVPKTTRFELRLRLGRICVERNTWVQGGDKLDVRTSEF